MPAYICLCFCDIDCRTLPPFITSTSNLIKMKQKNSEKYNRFLLFNKKMVTVTVIKKVTVTMIKKRLIVNIHFYNHFYNLTNIIKEKVCTYGPCLLLNQA